MDGDERYPIRPGSPPGRGRSRTPPGRAAGAGMAPASAYTLLAAGRRTGKTSLLRLLLDTAPTAASAHGEQYAAVARFVQGAPSTTTHIRACALDVVPDGRAQPVALELVDTPALDFADEDGAERVLAEIVRFVERRFEHTPEEGAPDNHVHLCLYFLDPDTIVPPPSAGSSPLADPRARAGSISQIAPSALNLEPPVPTHPARTQPRLPLADVAAIRRLSNRVNVLPVVARADTLTDARLTAVKLAVRRDLADAGIGFGIFDHDAAAAADDARRRGRSPSTSACQPPYALVAPEAYAHSDGTHRPPPARHELVAQYAYGATPPSRLLARGRHTRAFRWGTLDVLDPRHCDFMALRAAVFHHMETLITYTRDYLYTRYKSEARAAAAAAAGPGHTHHPTPGHPSSMAQLLQPQTHLSPYSHALSPPARLAHPDAHMLHAQDRDAPLIGGRARALSSASNASRMRGKKITVACNFCRSRKLKCDGGRPACSQCTKRDVSCDYIPHIKRRGPGKYKVGGGVDDSDEGEGDGEADGDGDMDVDAPEPEHTPPEEDGSDDQHSARQWEPEPARKDFAHEYREERSPDEHKYAHQPPLYPGYHHHPRVGSDGVRHAAPAPHPPPAPASGSRSPYGLPDREREYERYALARSPLQSLGRSRASTVGGLGEFGAHHPGGSGVYPVHHALPPLRPHGEEPPRASPPAKRRMSDVGPAPPSTLGPSGTPPVSAGPPKVHRPSNAGSKVVACNFCRARKTKCDSVHPTCSSCARRSLPCSYVNDPTARGAGTRKYSSATADKLAAQQLAGGGGAPPVHLRARSPRAIQSSDSSRSNSQSPPARHRDDEDTDVDELDDDDEDEQHGPAPPKRPRLGLSAFERALPVAIPLQ